MNTRGAADAMNLSEEPGVSVFFVRHGERIDEVEKMSWYFKAPHDKRGKQHARQHAVSTLHPHHTKLKFALIYSSPFRRCVETAAQIAQEFNIPIKIVKALGSCAAHAQERGIQHVLFDPLSDFAKEYPDIVFLEPDQRTDITSFLDVSARLAQGHAEQHTSERVLIVGHREGLKLVTLGQRIPYCGTVELKYHHAPRKWKVVTKHF